MESVSCQYMHVRFVKVLDAIVMIIQSIVYQERNNKPLICALYDPIHRFQFVRINRQHKFTIKYIQKCLFEKVNCIFVLKSYSILNNNLNKSNNNLFFSPPKKVNYRTWIEVLDR